MQSQQVTPTDGRKVTPTTRANGEAVMSELGTRADASAQDAEEHAQAGPLDDAIAATPDGDDGAGASAEPEEAEPERRPPPQVPLRALEDERSKRQHAQARAELLEQRLSILEQQQRGQAKSVEEDDGPDYDKLFEDPKSVFTAQEDRLRRDWQQERMAGSVEAAKAQFDDYDEVIGQLDRLEVPGIQEAVARSASPAHTAYRMVKQHLRKLADAQGADTLRQERDELRAQLAELQKQIGQKPVRSIAAARGARVADDDEVSVNDLAKSMFGTGYHR